MVAGDVLNAPRRYSLILDADAFDQWLSRLREAPLFAFDTETTSLDYMQARIVGLSFCIDPGLAAYLPLGHHYAGAPDQLPLEATLPAPWAWFEHAAQVLGLLVGVLERQPVDLSQWPGRGGDGPLYDLGP